MFRVLEAQLAFFADKARRDFVARMGDYLRASFGECVGSMSPEALRAWVSAGVAKAERYGITTEPEVAQLVLLFLVLGVDADETTPWVKEALSDRELLAFGKVRRIIERAREHALEGIDQVVTARSDRAAVEEVTAW